MSPSIAPSMPEASAKQKAGWPPRVALAPAAIVTIGLVLEVWLASAGQWRLIAVLPIGLVIGATLLLTNFGFASAFRQAANAGDFGTFRAHALMIGLATSMMTPILAAGAASRRRPVRRRHATVRQLRIGHAFPSRRR